MDSVAKLKGIRLSPRKARLVADQVRGKPVSEALDLLDFSLKKAGAVIRKTLESAIANAEHNHNCDVDRLRVAEIFVDAGPTLKRLRPRARGRADRITKPTSHITIRLRDDHGG